MAVFVGNRIAPIFTKAARRDADTDRRLPALVFTDTQQLDDALDILARITGRLDFSRRMIVLDIRFHDGVEHIIGRKIVLIDLIGAGALVGLGLFQLTPAVTIGEENWAMQLMAKLPELGGGPLLALGAGCALVSPENLVFYVKEGGMLLTNHTSLLGDLEVGGVFVAITTSLLLLPPLLWLFGGEQRLRAPLTTLNDWLVHRAEWLVGVFALMLGVYLGWQGLEGLHQLTLVSA